MWFGLNWSKSFLLRFILVLPMSMILIGVEIDRANDKKRFNRRFEAFKKNHS
jgi:hypothetical protein